MSSGRRRIGPIGAAARLAGGLVALIVPAVGATFVTPLDGSVGIWLFIGVSLLVGALRGDAGCEAVAIPNALAGRTDLTGCVIYAPLDAIEARKSRRPPLAVSRQEVHG
jgi:hypothetical protein